MTPRKIVQVAMNENGAMALADDGTTWLLTSLAEKWIAAPLLPDRDDDLTPKAAATIAALRMEHTP